MSMRSILITGCSSGIGLASAREMKSRGWRVFATARKAQDIARLRNEVGVDSLYLDYAEPRSIAEAAEQVLKATDGKLTALFNNGAYGQPGAVEDLKPDVLRAQFQPGCHTSFDYEALPEAAIRRHEFYDWLTRECGVKYFIGSRMFDAGEVSSFVSVEFTAKQGHADPHSIELFRLVSQHFANAWLIARRQAQTERKHAVGRGRSSITGAACCRSTAPRGGRSGGAMVLPYCRSACGRCARQKTARCKRRLVARSDRLAGRAFTPARRLRLVAATAPFRTGCAFCRCGTW
jgi:short subunit dehydrogenase